MRFAESAEPATDSNGVGWPAGGALGDAPGLEPSTMGRGAGRLTGGFAGKSEDLAALLAGVSPLKGTSFGLPPNQPAYRPPKSTPNTTMIKMNIPGRMRIL